MDLPPIPPRISAHEAHPWYWPWSHYLRVHLDGKEEHGVIHADTEAGQVWRYARDEHGLFVRDGDGLKIEQVAGEVRLTWAT